MSGEDKKIQLIQRAQWLRAAILGANDGLLSTTSLMLGVHAAKEDQRFMIISGFAGALAGACSMAVGEFASVSTQREIEQKAIDKSNQEKDMLPTKISRKLDLCKTNDCKTNNDTKLQIGEESIPAKDNHIISDSSPIFSPTRSFPKVISRDNNEMMDKRAEEMFPNPYKAAGASACAFLCGSLVPILTSIVFSHYKIRVWAIVVMSSIALAVFGAIGAQLGGSSARVSAIRVLVGGWFSMAVTYSLLMPFDIDHKG